MKGRDLVLKVSRYDLGKIFVCLSVMHVWPCMQDLLLRLILQQPFHKVRVCDALSCYYMAFSKMQQNWWWWNLVIAPTTDFYRKK